MSVDLNLPLHIVPVYFRSALREAAADADALESAGLKRKVKSIWSLIQ